MSYTLDTNLLDSVLQSPRLPSLPSVAVEVIELVQQQDVNIKRIAHTIQHDPALACKILKTVNSSFYGQSYSVSTVTHALVVLGLNSVKTLALGFSLVGNLRHSSGEGFDHEDYWRRSLYTATAAKMLAERAGLPQPEEAFLGGLLQDMGMVAMNQALGKQYAAVLAQAGGDHAALSRIEAEQLNLTHADVGAALAESWKLPPLLVSPVRYHETPELHVDDDNEAVVSLVRTVALGNRVAEVFMKGQNQLDIDCDDQAAGGGSGANRGGGQRALDSQTHAHHKSASLQNFYHQAESWFGLSREDAKPLLKAIHSQTGDMARLFDLPTGGVANPDEILCRANEAMMNLTLQTQQKQSELQRQNQQLNSEAHTDALTGVANRRAFDQYAAQQFAHASAESPLSVLFMDVDHFKHFNDTHGHDLGDTVLTNVAQALSQAVGSRGNVFRYGGEEFAIVCPMTNRRTAAGVAERIRQSVEFGAGLRREHDEALSVTVSIGVACEAGESFDRVEQLVKAADQGVYAAKAGGRNCVRVFIAKPKAQSQAAAA